MAVQIKIVSIIFLIRRRRTQEHPRGGPWRDGRRRHPVGGDAGRRIGRQHRIDEVGERRDVRPQQVRVLGRREEPQGEASNAVAERIEKAPVKKVARPKAGKTWLAIHRSNNAVYYKRLDPAAHTLLAHLRDGSSLQAACEAAAAEFPQPADFAPTLQGWFTQWSIFGWFCPRSETST